MRILLLIFFLILSLQVQLNFGASNLVVLEQFLHEVVGISYAELINLNLAQKNKLLNDSLFNLVYVESFLHQTLGMDYLKLINMSFKEKQDVCFAAINQTSRPAPVSLAREVRDALDSFRPTAAGFNTDIDFGEGFDLEEELGVGEYKGLDGDDNQLSDFSNQGPVNRVGFYENPMIGKYLGGAGYPLASTYLAINNNRINPDLLNLIPDNIKILTQDCAVDFYTEILVWNNLAFDINLKLIPFDAKAREFNLIFHGTMMSWFADKYPNYNFKTQNITENLLIGLFNYNGIAGVIAAGNNNLDLQPVNPHDGHFSPDNVRFKVEPDRNLVTLWSVAKSNDKKLAMVTYHILINGNLYQNQAVNIERACSPANSLRDFIMQIDQVEYTSGSFAPVDQLAWQTGLRFLHEMYRAYL